MWLLNAILSHWNNSSMRIVKILCTGRSADTSARSRSFLQAHVCRHIALRVRCLRHNNPGVSLAKLGTGIYNLALGNQQLHIVVRDPSVWHNMCVLCAFSSPQSLHNKRSTRQSSMPSSDHMLAHHPAFFHWRPTLQTMRTAYCCSMITDSTPSSADEQTRVLCLPR